MADELKKVKEYLKKIDDVIAKGPYKDDWSTMMNRKVPDWYRNAKFGIFIHWGVYAVPAFGNEWYPCHVYKKNAMQGGKSIYNHHVEKYGPLKDFGYKDFVPMFKAEKFDAAQWADLFKESGARFVMPVAEHCDGFQMYDSDLSEWCATKMGPMKDPLGMLKTEVEKRGMTLCASSHRMEHYWFMHPEGDYESDMPDPIPFGHMYWPSYSDCVELEDGTKSKNHGVTNLVNMDPLFMEDWLARTCEIVDKYRPKIVYFDWWIQVHPMKKYLKKFAAYYYNRAHEWGEEVTINYKNDSFPLTTAVNDIERGQLTDVSPYFWQNDTAVAKNSWCYTENNVYKESYEVVDTLVDVVSKNGSLLLDIGPKADGTIPDEDKRILMEVGDWLKVNGEGIYDTYPWKKYGEGPIKTKQGHFSDMNFVPYTSEDFRFTYKDGCLYVFAMNWPGDGVVHIKCLGSNPKGNQFNSKILSAEILGQKECEYRLCDDYLTIIGPKMKTKMPVCIKLSIE